MEYLWKREIIVSIIYYVVLILLLLFRLQLKSLLTPSYFFVHIFFEVDLAPCCIYFLIPYLFQTFLLLLPRSSWLTFFRIYPIYFHIFAVVFE
ncbi:hypothetical protein BDC45DRAFT_610896, partial [Circinella umbellata]